MAGADPRVPPATVGVLLDSPRQCRWILDCLRQALSVDGVRLGPLVVVQAAVGDSTSSRLQRLGDRFVEPARARRNRMFDPVDAAVELKTAPVRATAKVSAGHWVPDAELGRLLAGTHADVWLCFTAVPPRRRLPCASTLGVWGLEIGRGVPAASAWAGAAEVAAGSTVTMTSVVDYAADGDGLLYRSFGATVLESVRSNQLRALHKSMAFFRRLLDSVARTGRLPVKPATLEIPARYPNVPAPGPASVAMLNGRLLAAKVRRRVPKIRSLQWQIGYHFAGGDEPVQLERLRYLVPPRDRFWADPMAVEHDGRHWVFFEELPYSARKGHLAAIEVFEDRAPGPPVRVLERPYHLSYPFVFAWNGALWMIPETAGNRTIELYKCEHLPDEWQLHSVLHEGLNAFDATLWQDEERWWMLVNVAEPGADACDELHLFSSDSPLGPWTPHRANPVISDVRCARPAGPMFRRCGVLHRPSQDDSRGYGHSVAINRVDALGPEGYRETIVDRVSPGWRSDIERVHTLGAAGRLRVVDCMVARKRW